MATVTIGHHPELTAEGATEVFRRYFDGKYEVHKTRTFSGDFVVKKGNWTGVCVKLKQQKTSTTFVFTPLIPNGTLFMLLSFLFGVLITKVALKLRPSWKALEVEVREFIETSADFR